MASAAGSVLQYCHTDQARHHLRLTPYFSRKSESTLQDTSRSGFPMPKRAPFKPGILDQSVGVALVGVREQIGSCEGG